MSLALGILLRGCNYNYTDSTDSNPNNEDSTTEISTPEEVTNEVIHALKNKDMKSLSLYVHPSRESVFLPYAYVELESYKVFSVEQVEVLLSDTAVYNWGAIDGTSDPIEMTFAEYYDHFVYNEDYADAEQVTVNETIGHGNSIDNSEEIYPSATIVEYHFSVFDPQYKGMD